MFKRKKIVSFFLMVAMLMCISFRAFASETPHNDLQNVSTKSPTASDDIVTFGLNKPDSLNVNDLKDGKMTFSGNATLTGTIDGLEKDTLYYLTFSSPSDFSGYVQ